MKQIPLNLSYRTWRTRDDFCVSDCNAEAVAWIDKCPDWPSVGVLIVGEPGSGKTHLAAIFSENRIEAADLTEPFLPTRTDRMAVENAERLSDERTLLHLLNFMNERGGRVLLTASRPPAVSLPDLQSRLNSFPQIRLRMPDENLVRAVLAHEFQVRHIMPDDAVLDYAVMRLPRSYAMVHQAVWLADRVSLEGKKGVTIPVMKQVLENLKKEE